MTDRAKLADCGCELVPRFRTERIRRCHVTYVTNDIVLKRCRKHR